MTSSQPSANAQRVFRGFATLGSQDQDALVEMISRYRRENPGQRESTRKSFENVPGVDLGPLSGGCPCCGRG